MPTSAFALVHVILSLVGIFAGRAARPVLDAQGEGRRGVAAFIKA
jgi:hypothetical protein